MLRERDMRADAKRDFEYKDTAPVNVASIDRASNPMRSVVSGKVIPIFEVVAPQKHGFTTYSLKIA